MGMNNDNRKYAKCLKYRMQNPDSESRQKNAGWNAERKGSCSRHRSHELAEPALRPALQDGGGISSSRKQYHCCPMQCRIAGLRAWIARQGVSQRTVGRGDQYLAKKKETLSWAIAPDGGCDLLPTLYLPYAILPAEPQQFSTKTLWPYYSKRWTANTPCSPR
jgi:hypothetical protein